MESFRGRFTNKIDAKGRVSVPAKFRAVAVAQGLNGIICFPSFQGPFVEGGGPALASTIDEMLDRLDPFSPERDALAAVLIGDSAELLFDSDGRIMLRDDLREHAGITDQISFVGLGRKFQIWEPGAYEAFRLDALERARAHGDLLKSPHISRVTAGGAS
ncbi:MAG: division/cell wall cluster transcriptional repressor MraZ [Parvibaculaceae bacterium]|nr:division/cell wall cluster transcriptional repressor MraZ [Parvibaculaceae bacterium]